MTAIELLSAFLLAMSLSADCLVVTSCSSMKLGSVNMRTVYPISLIFAFIQTLFLFIGWFSGAVFLRFVYKLAHLVSFLLLLYVGGSMILNTYRNKSDVRSLKGIQNILMGGIATSVDALAVGISLSLSKCPERILTIDMVALFIVTQLSVVVGMFGGSRIGHKFGYPAQILGGIILIGLGAVLLFKAL